MINKIVNYISLKGGALLVFFKDNSSVTVDITTGARWGHNKHGMRLEELPAWAFEHITINDTNI